jgi:predicted amidohydrolase YtcJ
MILMKSPKRLPSLGIFLLAMASGPGAFGSDVADTVFINGKIITVDDNFNIVAAVAVGDGKFGAVGSNAEIEAMAGPETEVIDLRGRTVVPGFIDGHAHMDREGLKFILPSMHGVRSINDILDVISSEVERREPGEWIVTMPIGDYPTFASGSGLLDEQRYPTRWDLDQVAPDNPVYIKGIWYWWRGEPPIVSIANSYALRLAGISKDTQPPHAGIEIVVDKESGEPNGIFRETGTIGTLEYSLMYAAPRFSHEQRVAGLKDSMQRYNAAGTTSIYEGHGISPVIIRAYEQLHQIDELTVRSHLVMSPTWDVAPGNDIDKTVGDWARYTGGRGVGDDMLRVSGIHAVAGNSLQNDIRRKASTNPGWAGYSTDSMLRQQRGSLTDLLLAATSAGLHVNAITHTAELLEEYLVALETVDEQVSIRDRRFVLQHLSFVSEDHQNRIKALGILPTFLPGKTMWNTGLKRTKGLDEATVNTFLPLRSLTNKGIRFAFATDNVPIDPLHTLGAAITRKDGASGKVIAPDQKISRENALRAFTINAAALSFEEQSKGSIEAGKLADLAVLSADFLTVPADDIRHIDVLMTIVGGEIVYRHPDLDL